MRTQFTDTEIIKGYMICKSERALCESCPYYNIDDCEKIVQIDILDLINRIKEKNYQLIEEIEILHKHNFCPFFIGDELWDIYYNIPRKWEIEYIGYNGKEYHLLLSHYKNGKFIQNIEISYPFLGEKRWYRTKEETEQRLRR